MTEPSGFVEGALRIVTHNPYRRQNGAIEADVEILVDDKRVVLDHIAIFNSTQRHTLAESAARRMGTVGVKMSADSIEQTLERAAEAVWDELKEQEAEEETVDLARGAEPEPREWRIEDFAPERFPTFIYGGPGTLKTYLAGQMAICLRTGLPFLGRAVKACRVLVLDWELDETEYRRRLWHLARSLGLESPPGIYYRRMHRPLLTAIPDIRAEIARLGVEVPLIDSFSIAGCSEKDTAIAGIQALDSLGVTPIIFDHQARTLEKESYAGKQPFGSTFKEIGARAVWQVELANVQPSRWAVEMLLRNQKESFTSKQEEIAMRVSFFSDRVSIEPIDASESVGLVAKLPKLRQVELALGALSPTTCEAITAEVGFKAGPYLTTLKKLGKAHSEPTSERKNAPHTFCAVVPEMPEIVEKEEETTGEAAIEIPTPPGNGSKPVGVLSEWPHCQGCGRMLPICYNRLNRTACPDCAQEGIGVEPMPDLLRRQLADLHTCWQCKGSIECSCMRPDALHTCLSCLLEEVIA